MALNSAEIIGKVRSNGDLFGEDLEREVFEFACKNGITFYRHKNGLNS